jgi:hypothetical protein
MGRLRVTPKSKVKQNIPITRIGKKQYLKRRFAHVRAVDNAGKNNQFTQEYVKPKHTAQQSYTRLGLSMDPSATKAVIKERKSKVHAHMKGDKLREPEEQEGSLGTPVSEAEGTMIANLIEKYGNNFKRMSLDAKLNPFQLKPRQLQRKVVNYMRFERAAFPEEYEQAAADGLELEDYSDPQLRKRPRSAE